MDNIGYKEWVVFYGVNTNESEDNIILNSPINDLESLFNMAPKVKSVGFNTNGVFFKNISLPLYQYNYKDKEKGAIYIVKEFCDKFIYNKQEELEDEKAETKEKEEQKETHNKDENKEEISTESIEYLGMKNWTCDIPANSKEIFIRVLDMLKSIEIPKILEIGTFTGTSIIGMYNHLEKGEYTVIDNWNISEAELELVYSIAGYQFPKSFIRETFNKNMKNQNITLIDNYGEFKTYRDRSKEDLIKTVRVLEGDSHHSLVDLYKNKELFDFIYVDGSHDKHDAYMDIILSWNLLNKGGILGIDDFQFVDPKDPENKVSDAVNKFYDQYKPEIEVINIGYRVFLRKNCN